MENVEDKMDWIRNNLYCEGLEPHNLSIEWVIETIEKLAAEVNISVEAYGRVDAVAFTVKMRGSSGVLYRIQVKYKPKFAKLLATRYSEVELVEDDDFHLLMVPFRYILDCDIHWWDDRDSTWENICIHGDRSKPITCWPGDLLVTTMETLADDLRCAIVNEDLNTLRRELKRSYMLAWCTGKVPPVTTFEDVLNYLRHVSSIQNSKDRDEALMRQKIAIRELYGDVSNDTMGEEE
ncbi:MAG: hypothetical protein VYA86_01620 [Candidatus Thermoplasmatota archaeon]|nr:hypothetical protein [Candidatus Thermoplasmatota archaeon]